MVFARRGLCILTTVVVLLATIQVICAEDPQVTVAEGTLIGKTVVFSEDRFINVTKEIDAFLGIPYAEAPLRFEAPRPKQPWSGALDARSFREGCMQPFQGVPNYPLFSEDCLFLNVYAPKRHMPITADLPVMFWIHGGSFQTGTAMTSDYIGFPLVAVGDVILVTINYRLSIFSRFSTGDDVATGNYGMMDQVAALRWVNENIHAFGGDATKITLFGESAGGASVNFHLLSPLSKGLFSQAIMQSGAAAAWWGFEDNRTSEADRARSEELGQAMGCASSGSEELVACLRATDAEQLRAAALGLFPDKIIVDGTFLKDSPTNLYQRGNFTHVPIISGFNQQEGAFLLYFTDVEAFAGLESPPYVPRQAYDIALAEVVDLGFSNAPLVADAISQEYLDWSVMGRDVVDYFEPAVEMSGDAYFACPAEFVARAHADAGDTVYAYLMTHAPSGTSYFAHENGGLPFTPWLGPTHAEDIIFVFGWPFIDELEGIHGHNVTDDEKMLSVKWMKFWTNFAKSGDPSRSSPDDPRGEGEDSWSPFTLEELGYKEMSLQLQEGRAARAQRCHLWNNHLPDLAALTGAIDDPTRAWQESYASWQSDLAAWRTQFQSYQDNVCH